MFVTLEVGKVPAGGYEVGSHTLNSVHEHSGTSERGRLAIVDDDAGGVEPWPEPMDDITLRFLDIRSEVGKTTLRAFADLETWYGCGSLDI